jgi:hypothetical protein
MVLVKASEADFDFPMVGWSKGGPVIFSEREDLLGCPPVVYTDGDLVGMELIDNSLHRWVVRSVELCSPLPKLRCWQRSRFWFYALFPIMVIWLFVSSNRVEIDPQLEEIAPVDLDEVKTRVLSYLKDLYTDFLSDVEHEADVARAREAHDMAALVVLLGETAPPGLFE